MVSFSSNTNLIAWSFIAGSIVFTAREIIGLVALLFWLLRDIGVGVGVIGVRIADQAGWAPLIFLELFNAVSKELWVCLFQEWNINGCSELAFLPTPVLCHFSCKIVYLRVLLPILIWYNKFTIFTLILEELLQSALFFVNVQIDIGFHHLGHLLNVIKHIKILIPQLFFLAIRVFCYLIWN